LLAFAMAFLYITQITFGSRGNNMSEDQKNTDDKKSSPLISNQLALRLGIGIVLAVIVNQAFNSGDVEPPTVPNQKITTTNASSNEKIYTTASGEVLTARGCTERKSRSEREPYSGERLSRAEARDKFMLACVDRKNAEAGGYGTYTANLSTHETAHSNNQISRLAKL
jgi:hypothetical protein